MCPKGHIEGLLLCYCLDAVSVVGMRRQSGQFGYRLGDEFGYWHMLWAAGFGKAVVGGEQFFSHVGGDSSKEFSCVLMVAVAVVVHQMTHDVADAGYIGAGGAADIGAAGAVTAAGCAGVFGEDVHILFGKLCFVECGGDV